MQRGGQRAVLAGQRQGGGQATRNVAGKAGAGEDCDIPRLIKDNARAAPTGNVHAFATGDHRLAADVMRRNEGGQCLHRDGEEQGVRLQNSV